MQKKTLAAGRDGGWGAEAWGHWQALVSSADARATRADAAGWAGAPRDVLPRAAWLRGRIERGLTEGTLQRRNGDRALQALIAIRRDERGLPHRDGDLGRRDEARLLARLDDVSACLRWALQRASG